MSFLPESLAAIFFRSILATFIILYTYLILHKLRRYISLPNAYQYPKGVDTIHGMGRIAQH